ncbi:MAG: ATP-dependent DNA helicase RecG [Candidatus Magasanikbacteria bacterium]|nr:ATP-dependent DNA helicase RecG [Candidatus Magasanikbacteria bacterium]
MDLQTPVRHLSRVGKTLESRLKRLGIETLKDLLFYFPFRYEDYRQILPISELKDGQRVTISGTVELIANRRSHRKRTMLTEALVSDGTEQLRVLWFGQPFIIKNIKTGDRVYLSGKIKEDMLGVQMVGPAYEKVRPDVSSHTARIVPLYHLTDGITQKQLRSFIHQILKEKIHKSVEDWLPKMIMNKTGLMLLPVAIQEIHFPKDEAFLKKAETRLKFDELFILQLRAEMIRQSIKEARAESIFFKEREIKDFVSSLPFGLTQDQKKAAWEILRDLGKETPMNRLLEGEVGSGKTAVAALVLYAVALNKKQAAFMAPTEILARQHFESLSRLYKDKIVLGLLSASESELFNGAFTQKTKKGKREELLGLLKEGAVDILVGTHAILSESLRFNNLALVIVDEQQRFGVEQRKKIREQSGDRNTEPHFLSMTATPIPRSFALTLYGDLDISVLKEMPAGRKEIKTRFVDPHNREKAYDFIREQIKKGRQVFVVCPLIEEDLEKGNDRKSVLAEYEILSETIFPDCNIAHLHGKMKSAEKDKITKSFAAGETQILVSTSIIEVGVNIPNASVMLVEGAEHFGLAELHQFRGRVGRSEHQSYCFLFSDSGSDTVKERLSFFEKCSDGFRLAEYDLERRGPGDVYGTAQSGMMNLRLATMRDTELIRKARELARGIDFGEYPLLKEKVQEWDHRVHLE